MNKSPAQFPSQTKGASAADDAVSGEEETQIWQIARELGFSHDEYIRVRMAYSDKRTVLRRDDIAR